MFQLFIYTEAFTEAPHADIVRLLKKTRDQVLSDTRPFRRNDKTGGIITDDNGNRLGMWTFDPDRNEPRPVPVFEAETD